MDLILETYEWWAGEPANKTQTEFKRKSQTKLIIMNSIYIALFLLGRNAQRYINNSHTIRLEIEFTFRIY